MERKKSLDFIRSLAILSVLMLHMLEFTTDINPHLKYLMAYGWIGVDLFFVLSGFLIGQQIFNSSDESSLRSTYNFWMKRWTRTLPLYYLVLVIYVLLKPVLTHLSFNDNPLRFIFLIQNYFSPKDFVQSWSLCIEEQFYLFFPILFFFFQFKKFPKWVWIIPAFLSLGLRYIAYQNGLSSSTLKEGAFHYQFPLHTHLDGISYGLLLAAYKDQWGKIKTKLKLLPLGILALAMTCFYIEPTNYNEKIIASYHLLALSFSVIIISLYDFEFNFGTRFFTNTALWSYGIYLWNNLVARIIERQPFISNNFLKVVLFIVLTYLISFATYEIIEKPGLRLRKLFVK